MTGGAQDSGAIIRTMEREFWNGVPVVAYHWTIQDPECPIEGLRERPGIAYHWSTGPEDAARLISVADVEEYLSRATPAPAGWQPIDTMPLWAVGVVTDGQQACAAQKAESDFGGHYFAVDPEDGLEWEPTHWTTAPAEGGV